MKGPNSPRSIVYYTATSVFLISGVTSPPWEGWVQRGRFLLMNKSRHCRHFLSVRGCLPAPFDPCRDELVWWGFIFRTKSDHGSLQVFFPLPCSLVVVVRAWAWSCPRTFSWLWIFLHAPWLLLDFPRAAVDIWLFCLAVDRGEHQFGCGGGGVMYVFASRTAMGVVELLRQFCQGALFCITVSLPAAVFDFWVSFGHVPYD